MRWWHAPFLVPLKLLANSQLWEEAEKILGHELAEEASDTDMEMLCSKCGEPVAIFRMRSKFIEGKK